MRLAFISPFGLVPKATLSHRILPIAKALKKKGHEVAIFIPPYTNPEASGRVEERSGVKLVNIILPGKFFYSLRIGFRLANEAKRFNPEKLYIFKPKGYSALAGMILWFTGRKYPIYLDVDDLESDRDMEKRMGYTWWMRFFFRYQGKWLLKRAEAVTAASNYLKKYYGPRLGAKPINYLPNGPVEINGGCPYFNGPAGIGGIEDDAIVYPMGEGHGKREALKEKAGVFGKKIVLLYTRFTECPVKDIIDFVRTFSKRYSKGILLIVGEGYGKEKETVSRELKKMGLLSSVRFTGWIERDNLKDYLSLGDAAIYPMSDTVFNRAKCSAKLIELLAMGKPVVASPVGEVLTYIRDEESGLLAKDIKEMVEKVIGLLEDEERAKKIGEGARHFLSDNFNWDKLVSAIDEKR